MRLDLDFNDGGCFGARKGPECFPTAWAAFLRRAQVANFVDHGECGTGSAAVPRPAGLLSALTGARGWGCASLVGTRRFFAFRPVQTLGEVTDRGLIGFDFRLQSRFPLHQLLVLCPPVVRLPFQLDIGLFRQHHRLLGKGGSALLIPRRKLGGGYHLWQGTFHILLYTSFFGKCFGR